MQDRAADGLRKRHQENPGEENHAHQATQHFPGRILLQAGDQQNAKIAIQNAQDE
jgi:hypothetical protein